MTIEASYGRCALAPEADLEMLTLRKYINLPSHSQGGFDHGDVHKSSGRVFVAHTANGTIEVIDGERGQHMGTMSGCSEARGVCCAQDEGIVFAASRGSGKILLIDAGKGTWMSEVVVGSKPNGLAWDTRRKRLLVADVQDCHARLVDPLSQEILATTKLPGRPRWCVYHHDLGLFLVNIRDPAGLAILSAETFVQQNFLRVSAPGPHGLDIIEGTGQALVACDGKAVVVLDIKTGDEITTIPISGEPDVIWYNVLRERLYCAVGKPGVIEVIDMKRLTVDEEVTTEEGCHTLAFDQGKQRLYAFLPQSCSAAVYEEI